MQVFSAIRTFSNRAVLIWLLALITVVTGLAVVLPIEGQQVVALGLLVSLSFLCLRYDQLALPLALAYIPLGVRLNFGASLSLLFSFFLFDLICLKNFVWLLRKRDWEWFKPRPSVSFFLALFVITFLISTALSINIGLSLRKLYDFGQYLAVFVALVSTHRRYPNLSLRTLLEALLISSAFTALLGVLEFYSQFLWPTPYLARDYYLQHTAALFEGVRSFNLLKDGLDNWVLINGPLRAFGSLLTPAGLGQYLLMGVTILAVYVPLMQFRPGRAHLNWLLVWLTAELLLLAIFFTYARASWYVAFIVLGVVAVIWFTRRQKLRWPTRLQMMFGLAIFMLPLIANFVGLSLFKYHFTAPGPPTGRVNAPPTCGQAGCSQPALAALPKIDVAGPLALLLYLQNSQPVSNTVKATPTAPVPLQAAPGIAKNQQQPLVRIGEMFNLGDHSTQDRFSAWKYGFRAYPAHPLFGRGPGTFGLGGLSNSAYVKASEITPEVEQAAIQAHNMYLNFLVENGIIGLILYLLLLGYTLYRLVALPVQSVAALTTKLVLIIWLVAFSCDEFFDNLFLYTKNGTLLFVALGLAAILLANKNSGLAVKVARPEKAIESSKLAV